MDVSPEPPANIQGTKTPPFCCPKPEVLSGALPAERLVALEGEELASEEVKDKRRLGKIWGLGICTSWYGESTIIYRVLYISGGAGFLPSTVWPPPKKKF